MKIHHQNAIPLLETSFGFRPPLPMANEFTELVDEEIQKTGHFLTADELYDFFCKEYIENTNPFEITAINFEKEFINTDKEHLRCHASTQKYGEAKKIDGIGNGTLNALASAIKNHYGIGVEVADYLQHGLTQGSHALAASYIQLNDTHGRKFWGVGIDSDCTLSAIRALLSALNRSQR
jgi:2-isopropylmalate synthase